MECSQFPQYYLKIIILAFKMSIFTNMCLVIMQLFNLCKYGLINQKLMLIHMQIWCCLLYWYINTELTDTNLSWLVQFLLHCYLDTNTLSVLFFHYHAMLVPLQLQQKMYFNYQPLISDCYIKFNWCSSLEFCFILLLV